MTTRLYSRSVAIGLVLALGLLATAASAGPNLITHLRGLDQYQGAFFMPKAEARALQQNPSALPRLQVIAKGMFVPNGTVLRVRVNNKQIGTMVVKNTKARATFVLAKPIKSSDVITIRRGSKQIMQQYYSWMNH